jgi:hypothetical protein
LNLYPDIKSQRSFEKIIPENCHRHSHTVIPHFNFLLISHRDICSEYIENIWCQNPVLLMFFYQWNHQDYAQTSVLGFCPERDRFRNLQIPNRIKLRKAKL